MHAFHGALATLAGAAALAIAATLSATAAEVRAML